MQTTTNNIVRLGQVTLHCAECRLRRLCVLSTLAQEAGSECGLRSGRPLGRGQHLFRQGDRQHALFIVRSGSVKSYVSTPDGLEQVFRFHLPGDLIGVDALGDGKHTSSAQTLETTTLCRFPVELLEEYGRRDPAMYAQILKHAGREMSKEHHRSVLLAQRAAEERLATFLLQMSESYAQRGYSAHEFNLPMARQDIASYLALAVETISRLFSHFQQANLIEVDRRNVRIPSIDALRELAFAKKKDLSVLAG